MIPRCKAAVLVSSMVVLDFRNIHTSLPAMACCCRRQQSDLDKRDAIWIMTTFSPGILETLEVVSSSTAQASGICPSLAPESFFPVHGQLLSLKSASSVYQNPFVPLTPTLFPKILSVSYIIIGSGINTFIRCFLYSMHCAVCFVSLFHLLFTRPLEGGGAEQFLF